MLRENPATARMGYEIAKGIVRDAGYDPEKAILTKSDLILERQLLAGVTSYEFPVLDTQQGASGAPFNTEKRLKQQDSFIAAAWGFFVEKPTSASDVAFVPQTYANEIVFSTAGVAAAIEVLYNSFCTITVNGTVTVPYWSLSRHRYVPETQQSATNTHAQVDGQDSAFVSVEPNLIFSGIYNTLVNLTLAGPLAAVEAFQRGRIHYRGYLAQNMNLIKTGLS